MSNLITRVLVALAGIPLVIGIVWIGGWMLAGFIAVLAALGATEVYRLARTKNISAVAHLGAIAAAFLPLVVFVQRYELGIALYTAVCMGTFSVQLRRGTEHALASTAVTMLGVTYPASMLVWLIPLRQWSAGSEQDGIWLVLSVITGVWVCDTTAYFVGRAIGEHHLAPRVSPRKTWEGSIAGACGSIIWCSIMVPTWLSWGTVWLGTLIGMIIGTAGQIGDLAKSLLKRDAAVKDSGTLIPGHGGVLDRFDSISATAPVIYGVLVALRAVGFVP